MARALTTSEANQHLINLGYQVAGHNWIEDNELTEPFGKSSYYIQETTNMFDEAHQYRWWDWVGTRFSVLICENASSGKSSLYIYKYTAVEQTYEYKGQETTMVDTNGNSIINYAKLPAKDKKKFIEILEQLAANKQTYKLPQTNWSGETTIFGDALPFKIVELNSK